MKHYNQNFKEWVITDYLSGGSSSQFSLASCHKCTEELQSTVY